MKIHFSNKTDVEIKPEIDQIFLLILYKELMMMYVPSDPGPDLVQDGSPFGALQFTVDEVQSVLLQLDVNKGAGPAVHPLLRVHFLLFLTDLIDMWFSRQVEFFLRDTDIQERQAQQRRELSWEGYIICNSEAFWIAGL
jgi:hypothetical protein